MTFNRKKILIVDDDRDLLEIYQDIFAKMEVEVRLCDQGLEALELAKTSRFDIVITDLDMPQLDGMMLIACLRVSELNRNIPILVVSGALDQQKIEKLKKLNFIDTLSKPIDVDHLLSRVSELLFPKHPLRPIGYNLRIVETMQEEAVKVMQYYLEERPKSINPYIKRDAKDLGLVSAFINIWGQQVYGGVSLALDEFLLKGLVSRLFQIPEHQVNFREHFEICGELLNQYAGGIKSSLAEQDIHITIGLPNIFSHSTRYIMRCVNTPIVCLPFETSFGFFYIFFSFGEPLAIKPSREEAIANIFLYENDAGN